MHNLGSIKVWDLDQRAAAWQQLDTSEAWDVIVVGGGITGAGIYREAARRGLRVLLLEQRDFAWGTSSRSSKMVHGGLRYLGKGQLALAYASVRERQKLLAELPGLVEPLGFLLGHYRGKFPGPRLFATLLALYDRMAGRRQRRTIKQALNEFWAPGLRAQALEALSSFGDAVTDDARLVLRVLQAGNEDGGVALNYVRATGLVEENGRVCGLQVKDQLSAQTLAVRARHVINATGVWSDHLRQLLGKFQVIRPLRGSHLVLPFWRLPVGASCSFFHPEDGRPVFVFPWEGTTVVGTTDLDHAAALNQEPAITAVELDYLLQAANHAFPDARLARGDIMATWAGVRPVVSEQGATHGTKPTHKPSDEKREHAMWLDKGMLSVAGGKLTTYRLIAEEALQRLGLVGTTAAPRSPRAFRLPALNWHPCLSPVQRRRLLGRYGAAACAQLAVADAALLQRIASTDTLWWELQWACQHEAVQHLDDLLLRRTRLGLLLPAGGVALHEALQTRCQRWLNWDDTHWQVEWLRYQSIVARCYSLPPLAEASHAA